MNVWLIYAVSVSSILCKCFSISGDITYTITTHSNVWEQKQRRKFYFTSILLQMRGPSPNMASAGDAVALEELIRTTCLTKRIRPEAFFIDYDKLRSGFVTCKFFFFYRPRERVGKGFTHVCLSVCLSLFPVDNF